MSTLETARPVGAAPWITSALTPLLRSPLFVGTALVENRIRFQSRYFSSMLDFEVRFPSGDHRRFLAKFPKKKKQRGFAQLPEREAQDLEIAEREYKAFSHLKRTWPNQSRTRIAEPIFYDAASGMLVFDYLEGNDLWSRRLVRRLALRRQVNAEWLELIEMLGADLATYHRNASVAGTFDLATSRQKTETLARQLGARPPADSAPDYALSEKPLVAGIKGFEMRNALISRGILWLYDPGHIKPEPGEADVARFLTSVRMAGWGTSFFAIPLQTHVVEEAFLAGYHREGGSIDGRLLGHLMRREMLKNWLSGVEVTRQKTRLPTLVRRLLELTYVHGGYQRLWRPLAQYA